MAGIKTIVQPAEEPVTLNDIKTQMRIDADDTDYDDILTPLITAAREWCEGYQNRAYISQTMELALDAWPCGSKIELPRPPLKSVTSITYTDSDGVTATWSSDNHLVDDYSFVAHVVRKRSVSWPSACLAEVNAIKIRFVAGHDTAKDVPETTKQAITLLVLHWYENGMCDPPPAVLSLLRLNRVMPV